MLIADVRYPILTGTILGVLRGSLTGATVQRKRPAVMPAKLLTLRSDGGTTGQTLATVRFGVNVWAAKSGAIDAATVAESLAIDAARIIRTLPTLGVLKSVSTSLPFEVEDDPALTYQGGELAHFYFSFSGVQKGV